MLWQVLVVVNDSLPSAQTAAANMVLPMLQRAGVLLRELRTVRQGECEGFLFIYGEMCVTHLSQVS